MTGGGLCRRASENRDCFVDLPRYGRKTTAACSRHEGVSAASSRAEAASSDRGVRRGKREPAAGTVGMN